MDTLESRLDVSRNLNRVVYWMSLLVLVVCNLLAALFLVPFVLVVEGIFLYVIVGVMGLIFGLLFNYVIQSLEHLERKHHVFAAVLIPVISVVNLVIVGVFTRRIASFMDIGVSADATIVSFVYVGLFLLPYVLGCFLRK